MSSRNTAVSLCLGLFLLVLLGQGNVSADPCNVVLNQNTDFALSPNYPDSYVLSNCSRVQYTFALNMSATVHITFHVENVRQNVDFLSLTIPATNQTVTNMTGPAGVVLTMSNSSETVIQLSIGNVSSSPDDGPFRFAFNYTTENCSYQLPSGSKGVFHSPFYQKMSLVTSCNYVIPAVLAPRVVSFSQFDLKGDILLITASGSQVILPDSSGVPADLMLNQTDIILKFRFSLASLRKGVTGGYTVVSPSCTFLSDTIDGKAVITSPGYPFNYGNNLNCRWTLSAPPNTTVQVRFADFDLAPDADRLIVKDGLSKASPLLGSLGRGAAQYHEVLRTTGPGLWLQFTTDETGTASGFKVAISIEVDGGMFDAPVGNNASMAAHVNCCTHAPSHVTNVSRTVYYTLKAPNGADCQMVVVLDPLKTKLYPVASLVMHDGLSESSPKLVTFNAQGSLFYPVVASGNQMLLIAYNVYDPQKFSFGYFCSQNPGKISITYSSVGQIDVYNNVTADRRVIYPADSTSASIVLRLSKLNLGKGDSIVVAKGHDVLSPSAANVLLTVNSSFTQDVVIDVSGSTGARIDYKSGNHSFGVDKQVSLVYRLSHETVSNSAFSSNVSQTSGVLSSPNFPNNYPYYSTYSWKLTNRANKFLYLYGNYFNFGPSAQLAVWRGNSLFKVYNVSYPLPAEDMFQTTKEATNFVFNSGKPRQPVSHQKTGFSLNYTTFDCGGLVQGSSHSVSVPKSLAGSKFTCIWVIEVKAKGVNSSVNILNYTVNFNKVGSLEIRDGVMSTAPLANTTTGNKTKDAGRLLSRSNGLWVKLTGLGAKKPVVFSLSYQTYSCNKSQQCKNGICLHDDWRCDGVNQCGDGTDELNCTICNTGISSVALALSIVGAFIFGIVIAVAVPKIYMRCRYPNYSHLRDLMTPVET